MRLRFAVVIFAVSSLALAAERQGAGRCELSSGGLCVEVELGAIDLAGADLARADFSRSGLRGADLRKKVVVLAGLAGLAA